MNIFTALKSDIQQTIQKLAEDKKINHMPDLSRMTTEPPRDSAHGDVASNVAMVVAGQLQMKPRDFASLLAEELQKLPSV